MATPAASVHTGSGLAPAALTAAALAALAACGGGGGGGSAGGAGSRTASPQGDLVTVSATDLPGSGGAPPADAGAPSDQLFGVFNLVRQGGPCAF